METTEQEHQDDERGAAAPYEPSDGKTLGRVMMVVMGLAIGLLILSVLALGLQTILCLCASSYHK